MHNWPVFLCILCMYLSAFGRIDLPLSRKHVHRRDHTIFIYSTNYQENIKRPATLQFQRISPAQHKSCFLSLPISHNATPLSLHNRIQMVWKEYSRPSFHSLVLQTIFQQVIGKTENHSFLWINKSEKIILDYPLMPCRKPLRQHQSFPNQKLPRIW